MSTSRDGLRFLISALLAAGCLALPTLATDYYVRTDGSDNCNGTADLPGSSGSCAFRTITRANFVAGCGDTIHIGPGRFAENTKVLVGDNCSAENPKVFTGSGKGSTFWMGGLTDVNESTCVADSNPNVYRCNVPAGFRSDTAGNPSYCFVQRNSDAVRFLDANGVKGDMVGPVCVTWNTSGPASVSSAPGQVYHDSANNHLYIRPWNDKAPAQADLWAPSAGGYASGADGPVRIDGNHITLEDLTIIGNGYCTIGVRGDYPTLDGIDTYGGMIWVDFTSTGAVLRDIRIQNAYRRPTNNTSATAWGNTNSQVFSMKGDNFLIEDMETYAAREGIGFTGASNGTVNGLFAHGHHNHLLKFIDNAHDIELRDVITYNGQEPVFIECAHNLSFENCTFPFSHIVIQENGGLECSPAVQNLDFHNNAWCGIHFFNQYGPTWAGGGHDLDNNVYMSDSGNCYQNAWVVGAGGIKFSTLSQWQAWNGGDCPTCTRDPNSVTDTVANTWVSYAFEDDTLGVNYDFDLKDTSRAIDLGDPAYGDALDVELVSRSGRPDAGAFESGDDGGGGGGGGPVCGNGTKETGEECDGGDLGGATCSSLGYDSGSLSCSVDCTYDESDCVEENDPPQTPTNLHRTDVK